MREKRTRFDRLLGTRRQSCELGTTRVHSAMRNARRKAILCTIDIAIAGGVDTTRIVDVRALGQTPVDTIQCTLHG